MRTAVVLFTHDLRVRSRFLASALADLDRSLRAVGAGLVVREATVVRSRAQRKA